MRSSNPVFARDGGAFSRGGFAKGGYAGFGTAQQPYGGDLTAEQLEQLYHAPSAGPWQTGRMTMDDVVTRTAFTLLTLVASGAVAWLALPRGNYGLAVVSALAAFGVAMVINFKRSVSAPLILAYAALEGFFLGAVTSVLEARFPGIAVQAVLGTAAVFAAMLVAYRSGKLRVTPGYTRIGLAIGMGFVLLLAVNLLASAFGANLGLNSGPLGLLVGLIGVALGAFYLSLDFAAIEDGIRGGAPQEESWRAAFGLTLSLVWIYVEMLRLISILRGDD